MATSNRSRRSDPRPADPRSSCRPTADLATLVIGATGVLLPAVNVLLDTGRSVVAVARDRSRLEQVSQARATPTPGARAEMDPDPAGRLVTLAHDAGEPSFPGALRATLDECGFRLAAAVVYAPASSPEVVDALAISWRIPLVELLPSSATAPGGRDHDWSLEDLPPVDHNRRRLVLGWKETAAGPAWHHPREISRAALAALSNPGDQLLGAVAPWSRRPR